MTAKRVAPAPKGRRIRGLDAEQRAEQRRDLLLDAALDCFARDGYAGTSIEGLCQAAYVGNKAFYEHFSTKEACYLELLQRNTHTIVQRVTAMLDEIADDEATATHQLLSAFAGAILDDPRIAVVTFGQSGGISPTIERQRRANRREAAGIVRAAWLRFDDPPSDARGAPMAIATIGGLFDLVSDALDRTDYAPTDRDIDMLIAHMTDFALTVRAGMQSDR
ncbi:TetR/AcrR family transcriptional regulator [Jongsikchunia kroppenstedtii]|uniref:TetR/AcrR family transcriptional regulator n=1 Tax=Jongsikchunia kroppenstedtii TaxID=1121721 RepID=UPI0004774A10|nr:TetR/AcrR family transcriptional regulator [Jongsikchunia kroppenstedtii]